MKWRNEVLPVTASGELVSAAREERPSPSEASIPLQPDADVKQPTQQQVIPWPLWKLSDCLQLEYTPRGMHPTMGMNSMCHDHNITTSNFCGTCWASASSCMWGTSQQGLGQLLGVDEGLFIRLSDTNGAPSTWLCCTVTDAAGAAAFPSDELPLPQDAAAAWADICWGRGPGSHPEGAGWRTGVLRSDRLLVHHPAHIRRSISCSKSCSHSLQIGA